jgi:uncharacterized membrane protein YbhN (UPF0104 family)
MKGTKGRAARWVLGIALLGALLTWFNPVSIAARLGTVDVRLAMPAILGLVSVHLVAASAWRRLTERLSGLQLDWRTTIRLYYAAQAWGAITPANLGADIYRVAAIDAGAGRSRLAVPVVAQRLTSIGALLVLGFIGALLLPIGGLGSFAALLLVLMLGLAAGVAFVATRSGQVPGLIRRILDRLGLQTLAGPPRGWTSTVLRDGLGLGLVFHGASLLLGLVLVAAVDPEAASRPVEILAALAVARLSLAVPISPNGIGIQEGALTLLFVQLGLSPDTALAAALLNRIALVATAVIGSLALVMGSRTGAPRAAASSWSHPADS